MLISCGKYLIRIEGDNRLLQQFHPKWNLEIEDKNADAVLLLTDGLGQATGKAYGDWLAQSKGDRNELTYYLRGKPCFALQYGSSGKEITVQTSCFPGNKLRIGIQFGMMLALYRQCIGLHGVTLLCGREIIILSAPSGTGKTTLAKLLEKHCNAVTINGDFALLSPTEDGVIFEPTPFCGSSGRSLNHRFRVDRIVFLGQAKENTWRELNGREAITRFMSNTFVPTWVSDMQQTVQENILKSILMLKTNAYDFAPTQEAAKTFIRNQNQ